MRRNVAVLALAAATLIPTAASCSDSGSKPSSPTQASGPVSGEGHHGAFFPQCGGITDETVTSLTKVSGLVNTAQNSVGCQWLAGGEQIIQLGVPKSDAAGDSRFIRHQPHVLPPMR